MCERERDCVRGGEECERSEKCGREGEERLWRGREACAREVEGKGVGYVGSPSCVGVEESYCLRIKNSS